MTGWVGWVFLGCGVFTLLQVWWYEPRGMARTRARVARRGDPSKFDTFLASRRYRRGRWARLVAGVVLTILGLVVLSGGA
jgi:hypothetical protein